MSREEEDEAFQLPRGFVFIYFVTALTIVFCIVTVFPMQKLPSFDSDSDWRLAEQSEGLDNRVHSSKLQNT